MDYWNIVFIEHKYLTNSVKNIYIWYSSMCERNGMQHHIEFVVSPLLSFQLHSIYELQTMQTPILYPSPPSPLNLKSTPLTDIPEENPPIFCSLTLENDESLKNRGFLNNCTDVPEVPPPHSSMTCHFRVLKCVIMRQICQYLTLYISILLQSNNAWPHASLLGILRCEY